MVEDRCDRTIFKVERGTILVSKYGSRRRSASGPAGPRIRTRDYAPRLPALLAVAALAAITVA